MDDFVEFYLKLDIEEVFLSHNLCYLGGCVFQDDEVIPIYLPDKEEINYLVGRRNTILIDAQLSEEPKMKNLRRFTLMHEASHAILHRRYYCYDYDNEQLSLFDTDSLLVCEDIKQASSKAENDNCYSKNERRVLVTAEDWLEYQANVLASLMLMNEVSLSFILEHYDYRKDASNILREFVITQMSTIYSVSHEAARVRLALHDEYF